MFKNYTEINHIQLHALINNDQKKTKKNQKQNQREIEKKKISCLNSFKAFVFEFYSLIPTGEFSCIIT